MTTLLTRRTLLQIGASAGGFAIGCSLGATRQAPRPPIGARIHAWIWIGQDDTITVRVAHTEMGQGIHTLTAMLVAEEPEVDPGTLRVEAAPVGPEYQNPLFKEMVTGNGAR